MLHHYKSPSRAWAPMAMDNKIGEDNECNGRSGKSFFFKTLSLLMKTVKLSGRNPKLMDNPHVFDQVTQHTQMLLLDDCDRYLNTGLFYDNITSDMTVNPKNTRASLYLSRIARKLPSLLIMCRQISIRLQRRDCCIWCSQTIIISARRIMTTRRPEASEMTSTRICFPRPILRPNGMQISTSSCNAAASTYLSWENP